MSTRAASAQSPRVSMYVCTNEWFMHTKVRSLRTNTHTHTCQCAYMDTYKDTILQPLHWTDFCPNATLKGTYVTYVRWAYIHTINMQISSVICTCSIDFTPHVHLTAQGYPNVFACPDTCMHVHTYT